jgi:hypothetical protein
MAFKIPGGRDKDKPLDEASPEGINYWLKKKREKLAAEPAHQYVESDKRWIDAAEAELKRRAAGGQVKASAPKPTQAITKAPERTAGLELAGAWNEAKAVDAELRKASENMHLVAPATVCGALPEGCEVALSIVYVDPSTDKTGPGDVYPVGGGKLGLSGTTLSRIGAAAGIDWDMERSGRLDNGRDPHYCHYRAVGTVRNFDGSVRTLSGEVEIDAREGSPQIDEIRAKQAGKQDGDGGASQILELRKFLLRHAERKAKNRAIADMGIKRDWTAAELTKPFAVARLMATGRSNDPALRKEMALMNFDKMTSGRAALYGAPTHATPRLAPPQPPMPAAPGQALPAYRGHEPPPLGAVHDTEGEPAPDSGRPSAEDLEAERNEYGGGATGTDDEGGY